MEQTFTQASAWGEDLPKAFSAAMDAYVASGHIVKIQNAITSILFGKQFTVHSEDEGLAGLDGEMVDKIMALIVENRLRMPFTPATCGDILMHGVLGI